MPADKPRQACNAFADRQQYLRLLRFSMRSQCCNVYAREELQACSRGVQGIGTSVRILASFVTG
jgi:hypothetical protein